MSNPKIDMVNNSIMIGRIAVRKALRNGEDGAKSFSSVCLWKQSKDIRVPELEPTLWIGVNRSFRF